MVNIVVIPILFSTKETRRVLFCLCPQVNSTIELLQLEGNRIGQNGGEVGEPAALFRVSEGVPLACYGGGN